MHHYNNYKSEMEASSSGNVIPNSMDSSRRNSSVYSLSPNAVVSPHNSSSSHSPRIKILNNQNHLHAHERDIEEFEAEADYNWYVKRRSCTATKMWKSKKQFQSECMGRNIGSRRQIFGIDDI